MLATCCTMPSKALPQSRRPRTHGKLFAERAAEQGIELMAPDGGWGWFIVVAFATSHFFLIPIIQLFGLIYNDKFKRIGITAIDISIILNVNSAIGFGFGLMNGPLMRRFTVRQISTCGSLLLFTGTLLTAFANSMPSFILSFSIIFALGFSLLNQPQSFALNSYFLRLRGRAISLAVASCGFGPVLMPLLAGVLLDKYGPQGTMLLLAALLLHCLPATALLQPVRWHMIRKPDQEFLPDPQPTLGINNVAGTDEASVALPTTRQGARLRTITISSVDVECHSLFALETPLVSRARTERPRTISMSAAPGQDLPPPRPNIAHSVSQQPPRVEFKSSYHWWSSEDTVYLGSSAQIFEDIRLTDSPEPPAETAARKSITLQTVSEIEEKKTLWIRTKLRLKTYGLSIVKFFDLSLFCLPGYASIAFGMAIAMFAEINFSLLFPFILREMHGFSVSSLSQVMAAMAACDIVFRFAAPYIGEAAGVSHKSMYIISLVMLTITRSLFLVFREFGAILVLGCALGVAKGLRTVFMPLVIPSHVPLERLAAATGLQMVCNGLLFLLLGPLIGALRDYSGSYFLVVVTVNTMTMVTVVTWTSQGLLSKYRGYRRAPMEDAA